MMKLPNRVIVMGTLFHLWTEMMMVGRRKIMDEPILISDTIRLRIVKVFKCVPCGYILRRQDVWKDRQGKYHCGRCHREVEDITNTVTGHDFLEILAL